jgi:hypothetical protein
MNGISGTPLSANDFDIHTLPQPVSELRVGERTQAVRCYNPSLTWHRGKLLMAFRISSLMKCDGRSVDFARSYAGVVPPIVNGVGMAHLDPVTLAIADVRVLGAGMPAECSWTIGYEDPRVFSYAGILFVIAFHRNRDWTFVPALIELDADLQPRRVTTIDADFDRGAHQKNWNAFIRDDELLFVGSIVPHQIVRVDLATGRASQVHQIDTALFHELEAEHHLRGGAGYLRCDDRYVGVCRAALKQAPDENTNQYLCIAYAFEAAPPFRPMARSDAFHFGTAGRDARPIQMATGLVYVDGDCLIGFGEDDCHLKIARLPTTRFLASITP